MLCLYRTRPVSARGAVEPVSHWLAQQKRVFLWARVCTCVLLQPPRDRVPDVHRAFYKLAETDGRGLWHLPAGDRIAFPHKATRCFTDRGKRESLDSVNKEGAWERILLSCRLTLKVREIKRNGESCVTHGCRNILFIYRYGWYDRKLTVYTLNKQLGRQKKRTNIFLMYFYTRLVKLQSFRNLRFFYHILKLLSNSVKFNICVGIKYNQLGNFTSQ